MNYIEEIIEEADGKMKDLFLQARGLYYAEEKLRGSIKELYQCIINGSEIEFVEIESNQIQPWANDKFVGPAIDKEEL